jgi:hypothetical protein
MRITHWLTAIGISLTAIVLTMAPAKAEWVSMGKAVTGENIYLNLGIQSPVL